MAQAHSRLITFRACSGFKPKFSIKSSCDILWQLTDQLPVNPILFEDWSQVPQGQLLQERSPACATLTSPHLAAPLGISSTFIATGHTVSFFRRMKAAQQHAHPGTTAFGMQFFLWMWKLSSASASKVPVKVRADAVKLTCGRWSSGRTFSLGLTVASASWRMPNGAVAPSSAFRIGTSCRALLRRAGGWKRWKTSSISRANHGWNCWKQLQLFHARAMASGHNLRRRSLHRMASRRRTAVAQFFRLWRICFLFRPLPKVFGPHAVFVAPPARSSFPLMGLEKAVQGLKVHLCHC